MDFIYDAIVIEEMARVRAHGLMMGLHSDICLPYLVSFGSEEQKRRWAPGAISGDVIMGIAMTEPGTGSDLAAVQTTARRDGDSYVINGSKIFISNGQIADLFVVVVKTDPKANPPHRGVSLILVEADAPGFVRGRKLDKLGFRGQDTSELFFEDCRVPVTNLLGPRGRGLQDADGQAAAGAAGHRGRRDHQHAAMPRRHHRVHPQRKAFGQPIASFQNTQFKLAEMMTEVEVGQAFVDRLLAAHVRGEELVTEVSMAKWWVTELLKRVVKPVPAAARRLWLHDGVSGGDRLRRRGSAIDLRGHQRDHEGDHRAPDGPRRARVTRQGDVR